MNEKKSFYFLYYLKLSFDQQQNQEQFELALLGVWHMRVFAWMPSAVSTAASQIYPNKFLHFPFFTFQKKQLTLHVHHSDLVKAYTWLVMLCNNSVAHSRDWSSLQVPSRPNNHPSHGVTRTAEFNALTIYNGLCATANHGTMAPNRSWVRSSCSLVTRMTSPCYYLILLPELSHLAIRMLALHFGLRSPKGLRQQELKAFHS